MARTRENNNMLGLLLIGGGLFWFYRKQIIANIVEDFEAGIAYSFQKIRLKLSLPVDVVFMTDWKIHNTNSFGVQVFGFDGQINYGKDGLKVAPFAISSFNLAPGSEQVITTNTSLNLLLSTNQVRDVLNLIGEGHLHKLWIQGTLKTSIKDIKVSRETPLIITR